MNNKELKLSLIRFQELIVETGNNERLEDLKILCKGCHSNEHSH